MGQPIRILDLAHELIIFSGFRPDIDIPIVITGLRPGERRHERLWADDEILSPTPLPKIKLVRSHTPPRADLTAIVSELEAAAVRCDRPRVRELLERAVPSFRPQPAPAESRGEP
jgi:O-antigen biosynthesis protein WbqV